MIGDPCAVSVPCFSLLLCSLGRACRPGRRRAGGVGKRHDLRRKPRSSTPSPGGRGTPRRANRTRAAELPERRSAADVQPFGGARNDARRRERAQRRGLPGSDRLGALPERRRRDARAARRLLLEPRREPRDRLSPSRSRRAPLPFSPYYFPDVVRNADGSLTGYFDYRPKDADEAITVARSTDNGKTLDQRGRGARAEPGLLPDGGHERRRPGPSVRGVDRRPARSCTRSTGRPATTKAWACSCTTSNRPPRTHSTALPASEPVGIDPNTFAAAEVRVPTSGGANIPVSTLGEDGLARGHRRRALRGLQRLPRRRNRSSPAPARAPSPHELTGCTVAGLERADGQSQR